MARENEKKFFFFQKKFLRGFSFSGESGIIESNVIGSGESTGDLEETLMMIGISSTPYAEYPPEEVIRLAKQAGLSGIAWSHVHSPAGDGERGAEIRALTEAAGLSVPAYSCAYSAERGFDPEPVLRSAEALGAGAVILHAGSRSPSRVNEIYYAETAQALRQLCAGAEALGMEVWLSCQRETLTERADSTAMLLRMADCSNLRVLWLPQYTLDVEENLRQLHALSQWISGMFVFAELDGAICPLLEDMESWRQYLKVPAGQYLIAQVRDAQPSRLMSDVNVLRVLLHEAEQARQKEEPTHD